MSNANDANLYSSSITRGAGLTATDAWDRFNATSWATTSIENAVSGNKYVEFTITPRAGFRFTVSSITVQWRCSGTGGTQIALRSSVDNYASNLGGVKSVSDSISATTLSWISGFSGSSSSAVTYRLYSYVQNATGQGGPGGGSGNDIVVYGTFTAIPSAPTITRITPGDGQLSVEFTAGSDGGSSIMNYQYSTDGGTSWWYAPTTSPLLITRRSTDGSSLANGTSYDVQIRAVSMDATGTATASIAATPRTTPGAPMILSVTPGNGQLTVSFGAPSSDGGSPIRDYEYSIDGGASFMPRLSTSTTFVIGSLMNGVSYNVQVRAVNDAGRSTAYSGWAGTPRTTPNAPFINYVTPGNRQISVGFMGGGDGGSAITNYQYSTDGGTSWRTHTSTFSPILITTLSTDGTTALANGTSYNVQLRAVNAAGSGTATSSTAATPRTTPGAPTSLALTPGNGQLTASFFAPSDGGSPITHYEYSINGGSSFTSILSTSTTIVIGSLMNGSSYDVQVRAVNAVGSGTATASVAGTPTAQASQTITFGALGTKNYGAAAFSAGASASSGLTVSYVSSNPNVATVLGDTVTIVGVGTTIITASQAGNSNYLAAADVSQTLTVQSVLSSVDGATISLDFQVADTTGYVSHANGWSTSDTLNRPDGYVSDSVNSNNILGLIGGIYSAPSTTTTELTYNFNSGNSDRYVFQWNQNIRSSVDFTGDDIFGWKFLSGNDTAFSIRFLNDSGPNNDRDLLVQGYDGAGNALGLAAGQPNDWFIDRDDANDFRVTADLASKKWALDVFNKSNNSWYGLVLDAAINPALTSLNGIAATWAVVSTNGASGAGDNFMSFDNLTLQGKQTVVINLNIPTNAVYNGLGQAVTATTTPTNIAVVIKYDGSTNIPVNANTNGYIVTAEVVDTNTYYNAPTSGSLVVAKATITATADLQNRNFGDQNPALTIDYSGFENGETSSVLDTLPTASCSADANSPVGPYDIVLTGGSDNNYNFILVDGILNVDPISATGLFSITLPVNLVYDGTPKECAVATSGGPTSFEITYDGDSNVPTDAGTYTVVATVTDPNYNADFVMETMVISKAPQTITFPWLPNGTEGGSATLTATSSSGLTVSYTSSDLNVATFSANTVNFVGVGLVNITASQPGNRNYEAAEDVTITLSVLSADTPWDTWADGYSLANGTNRAKNADPDGDGFNNAMEFAFGLNPTTRDAAVFTAVKSGANYLVTFKKRKSAAEATYDFRSSTNLTQTFSAGTALTPGTATSIDSKYEQVSVSIPITGVRGFIRGQATILVDPSR